MRLLLGLVALLVLSGSLAGCFERRGSLAIDLVVSSGGDVNDFSRINLTLDKVRIDARTLNPETVDSLVDRLEVVRAASDGAPLRVFQGEVRADRYDRITITTPPGGRFDGQLRDGTPVAVIVPGSAFTASTTFEVGRGATVVYVFTIEVQQTTTGTGLPTYSLVPLPEESGPR